VSRPSCQMRHATRAYVPEHRKRQTDRETLERTGPGVFTDQVSGKAQRLIGTLYELI
jgi:hypothetical protein